MPSKGVHSPVRRGVAIVIHALELEQRRYAVEANLYKEGVVTISTERSYKKYMAIQAELDKLKK